MDTPTIPGSLSFLWRPLILAVLVPLYGHFSPQLERFFSDFVGQVARMVKWLVDNDAIIETLATWWSRLPGEELGSKVLDTFGTLNNYLPLPAQDFLHELCHTALGACLDAKAALWNMLMVGRGFVHAITILRNTLRIFLVANVADIVFVLVLWALAVAVWPWIVIVFWLVFVIARAFGRVISLVLGV
ncbi:hypothetical protein CC80DRAFT_541848 [Byssothecium circinans]|uniref:Uncharacterized protein n=1 Tax=Byssothecium circinans TaxID=147558 RepID=A0A6A5UFH2_9PLEO|nr:hypothetical protein CC80DRAFT_541848 [Byssothecium circinans]